VTTFAVRNKALAIWGNGDPEGFKTVMKIVNIAYASGLDDGIWEALNTAKTSGWDAALSLIQSPKEEDAAS
jgi:hypothetical protein